MAPSRQVSYSKRHASFDSPREVPLPPPHPSSAPFSTKSFYDPDDAASVPAPASSDRRSPDDFPVFDSPDGSGSASSSRSSRPSPHSSQPPSPSSLSSMVEAMDITAPEFFHSRASSLRGKGKESDGPPSPSSSRILSESASPNSPEQRAHPISPYARPYSTPEMYPGGMYAPRPVRADDRNSTASLPLPHQTPFHMLPPILHEPVLEEREDALSPFKPGAKHPRSEVPSPQPRPTPLPPIQQEDMAMAPPAGPSALAPSSPTAPSFAARRCSSSSSENGRYPHPSSVSRNAPSPPLSRGRPARPPTAPPEPPQVLPPQPSLANGAHANFLSHASPAVEVPVAVETTPADYRLLIRLPGFNRDMITLAVRRRRILHVLADSWAPGGGHFERRISFGYDAELALVRAEFNGEVLTIVVPRRAPPRGYLGAPAMR